MAKARKGKKSKAWLWIILAVLLIGGIGVGTYYTVDHYQQTNQEQTEEADDTEQTDQDLNLEAAAAII